MLLLTITDCLMFALLLLAMLLINSLMIRGLHLILQGRTEIRPDGKKVYHGKIGYPIRAFFDQYTIEKVFYTDGEFLKLVKKFQESFPHIQFIGRCINGITTNEIQLQNFQVNKVAIENVLMCKMEIEFVDKGGRITFYKEYNKYLFSEKFRDVFYGCPPCMSTVYGTIFYWTVMIYILDFLYSQQLFVIWIGYWLALAYTNFLIEKK